MKNMTTTLLALGLIGAALPQAQAADSELILTVTDIASPQGTLMVAVFNEEAAWNGGAPVTGARIEVNEATVTASLGQLPHGQYAIRMYHDVNDNGELDTNLMGIPSEPFAFSNNAQGRFGPAAWDDAVFEIGADAVRHTVRLD